MKTESFEKCSRPHETPILKALPFNEGNMLSNPVKTFHFRGITKSLSIRFFALLFLFFGLLFTVSAGEIIQDDPVDKIYVITKNDGSRFVGKIISQDAREVLLETKELGQVFIPRHEIREIREVAAGEIGKEGFYTPAEVFSTRYFITTNGLPIARGETYILWNLFGPDFQVGIRDNLGVGVMTTWVGTPIIGSIKYSIPLENKWSAGLGLLAGTGSWGMPELGIILPYAVITHGDRVKNINFSFGYGGVTYKDEEINLLGHYVDKQKSEGNFLMSLAGMTKLGEKASFVFDSFIVPRFGTYQTTEFYEIYNNATGEYTSGYKNVTKDKKSIWILVPGLRFQTNPKTAFQFGFAGVRAEGEWFPLPFPMVQWFRKL
jgi:hypothetical protein